MLSPTTRSWSFTASAWEIGKAADVYHPAFRRPEEREVWGGGRGRMGRTDDSTASIHI